MIDQSDGRATVHAELAYLMQDGRQVMDTGPYVQLILDPATGRWLSWDKGDCAITTFGCSRRHPG